MLAPYRSAAALSGQASLSRLLALCGALVVVLLLPQLTASTPGAASLEDQLAAALKLDQRLESIELLKRLIERDGPSTDRLKQLAQLQIQADDLERAAKTLAQLEKLNADGLDALRGDLAMANNDPATAIAHWKKAVTAQASDDKTTAGLLQTLVRAMLRQQEADPDITTHADQLVALNKSAENLVLRCRARLLAGDWQGAYDDCFAANALDAEEQAVKSIFPSFERLGRGAVAKLTMLNKTGDAMAKARILAEAGLFEPAAILLKGTISPETKDVAPRLFYAGILAESGRAHLAAELGVMTRAKLPVPQAQLDKIAKLDAKLSANPSAEDHFMRAWLLNDSGQYVLAIKDCEAALAARPNDARALTEAAFAYLQLDDKKKALELIIQSTEQPAPTSHMWRLRGDIEVALARHDEAIKSYEKSLALENSGETRSRLDRARLIAAPK